MHYQRSAFLRVRELHSVFRRCFPPAALAVAAMLASCATPEHAAQLAEDQLTQQCAARGGTYEPLAKSGQQTSDGVLIPFPIGVVGRGPGVEGYATGFCTGPNPAYATACFEQGQLAAPPPASSGCITTDEATRKNLLTFMQGAHRQCDPKGQAVGTATEPGGMLRVVCLAS